MAFPCRIQNGIHGVEQRRNRKQNGVVHCNIGSYIDQLQSRFQPQSEVTISNSHVLRTLRCSDHRDSAMGIFSSPPPPHLPSGPDHAPSFNPQTNPYKAKRLWPPDFSKMTHHQQFAFEKKYKRRAKYSYLRPSWVRKVKLVQFLSVTSTRTIPLSESVSSPKRAVADWHGMQRWQATCSSSPNYQRGIRIPSTRYASLCDLDFQDSRLSKYDV